MEGDRNREQPAQDKGIADFLEYIRQLDATRPAKQPSSVIVLNVDDPEQLVGVLDWISKRTPGECDKPDCDACTYRRDLKAFEDKILAEADAVCQKLKLDALKRIQGFKQEWVTAAAERKKAEKKKRGQE